MRINERVKLHHGPHLQIQLGSWLCNLGICCCCLHCRCTSRRISGLVCAQRQIERVLHLGRLLWLLLQRHNQHHVRLAMQLNVHPVLAHRLQLALVRVPQRQSVMRCGWKVLQSLLAPSARDPVAQLRDHRGQLAVIVVQRLLQFRDQRTVHVLRHVAMKHARVRVHGDVNLFRAQTRTQDGNG